MPISPSPHNIVLSVAEHIPDQKGVVVIDHIFKEVLSFPSAPNWIPTIQDVFEKLHGAGMTKSRRLIAQHVRSLYDDVRDLTSFRDPLVTIALQFWEVSLLDEDNEDTVADILAVLSDAIVAGAAEEQTRESATPHPLHTTSAHSIDRRIVDLLVRVAANCGCSNDVTTSVASSDRGTLQRGALC